MAPRSHKQNGTEAETAVQRELVETWLTVRRLPPAGANDVGDLDGVPLTAVQVKRCKAMALASWVDEVEKQAANAGKPLFVVIHKRPRKGSPADWYVTMPLKVWVKGWKP